VSLGWKVVLLEEARPVNRALRLTLLGLAVVIVVSTASAQSSLRPSGKSIYCALLTTPIRAGSLPANFYSAKVNFMKPSKRAKSHHAVGEVEVDIDGGDDAAIFYVVFPTRADAVADWKDTDWSGVKTRRPAPQFPQPAVILNGPFTVKDAAGKTVTYGYTGVASVPGGVIVSTVTRSTKSKVRGDVPGAIALERFALRHLSGLVNRMPRRCG
jgi:hypothetical protein